MTDAWGISELSTAVVTLTAAVNTLAEVVGIQQAALREMLAAQRATNSALLMLVQVHEREFTGGVERWGYV